MGRREESHHSNRAPSYQQTHTTSCLALLPSVDNGQPGPCTLRAVSLRIPNIPPGERPPSPGGRIRTFLQLSLWDL